MKCKKAISIVVMFSLVVSTTQLCSCVKNPTRIDINVAPANNNPVDNNSVNDTTDNIIKKNEGSKLWGKSENMAVVV